MFERGVTAESQSLASLSFSFFVEFRTHPGHGVAQRLEQHHARTDPGALEERGGGGAERDRVVIGGGLGFLAPHSRQADGQRRQRHFWF